MCFLKNSVFVVKVPILEPNQTEVKVAMVKKMQNLED